MPRMNNRTQNPKQESCESGKPHDISAHSTVATGLTSTQYAELARSFVAVPKRNALAQHQGFVFTPVQTYKELEREAA